MTEPGETSRTGRHLREVEAIANGTVIDHIPARMTLKVAALLPTSDDRVFMGLNLPSARMGTKGVLKVAGRELDERTLSCLALLAPQATVCIIRDYTVVAKHPVPVPARFEGIARCANPNCVTNHEKWSSRLDVVARVPLRVRCFHCERSFPGEELAII